MKLYIKEIPGVRGFVGITYAVVREDAQIIKIFLNKKEAEKFIENEEK